VPVVVVTLPALLSNCVGLSWSVTRIWPLDNGISSCAL